MYEKILVPLDGSSAAETALPYAEEIAARFGAEIILASVSEQAGFETDQLYISYLAHTAEQVQRRLKESGPRQEARVNTEILIGHPAYEILQYADRHNISLIAMASRGRSTRGPWLLGNIAAKVLRATVKPVLLVRTPAGNTALQERNLIRRILVPLDGSKLGEVAIPQAEALSKALGAEIVLFQTFLPPALAGAYEYRSTLPSDFEQEKEQMKKTAMAYLDTFGKALQNRGVRTTSVVSHGHAAERILEYAEMNRIDLIAMSTHGRSGIGRWVLGSVTDKVLHAGDTAVLTVRAIQG